MKLVFLTNIIQWLEANQLSCPIKKLLNIDCPGCGLQTSFIALLNGNWQQSFHQHIATIPLIIFFLFAAVHLKYRFKNGNKILVYSYLSIALLIASNYIYKIIYHTIT